MQSMVTGRKLLENEESRVKTEEREVEI